MQWRYTLLRCFLARVWPLAAVCCGLTGNGEKTGRRFAAGRSCCSTASRLEAPNSRVTTGRGFMSCSSRASMQTNAAQLGLPVCQFYDVASHLVGWGLRMTWTYHRPFRIKHDFVLAMVPVSWQLFTLHQSQHLRFGKSDDCVCPFITTSHSLTSFTIVQLRSEWRNSTTTVSPFKASLIAKLW